MRRHGVEEPAHRARERGVHAALDHAQQRAPPRPRRAASAAALRRGGRAGRASRSVPSAMRAGRRDRGRAAGHRHVARGARSARSPPSPRAAPRRPRCGRPRRSRCRRTRCRRRARRRRARRSRSTMCAWWCCTPTFGQVERERPLGRQVLGVQVVGDELRARCGRAARRGASVASKRLERLGVLQVADVLGDERVAAASAA